MNTKVFVLLHSGDALIKELVVSGQGLTLPSDGEDSTLFYVKVH